MKNEVKELTEGMQRLCAVANRVVAQEGQVAHIEVDLLLESLRRLYDVALRLGGDALPVSAPTAGKAAEERPVEAEDGQLMAVMASVAAMTAAPVESEEQSVESEKQRVEDREPQPTADAQPPVTDIQQPAADSQQPTTDAQQPATDVQQPADDPQLPIADELPAEEPTPVAPAPIPSMEELEHNDNALLFDEVILHPEPEAEPVAAARGEQRVASEEPQSTADEPSVRPVAEGQPGGQASLLDYLTPTGQRTLGETLAEGRPAPTALERKVDDLRTVININDKFSFMSELFHNNMKAYNDFILRLNALKDREEALAQVREVAQQQRWVEGSPTVQTFYKIFDKKF